MTTSADDRYCCYRLSLTFVPTINAETSTTKVCGGRVLEKTAIQPVNTILRLVRNRQVQCHIPNSGYYREPAASIPNPHTLFASSDFEFSAFNYRISENTTYSYIYGTHILSPL
jgi:hypothetical protein